MHILFQSYIPFFAHGVDPDQLASDEASSSGFTPVSPKK